jgi:hypothetical protein
LLWWLKLQKERERAHKKKDKRSDKKAPQLGETSKHSKHNHKKRKLEDVSTGDQEPKKVFKESAELLEKSGLSEEHGAPCFVQMFRDSPESSQDSSKRRKAVLPSPSQAKNGETVFLFFILFLSRYQSLVSGFYSHKLVILQVTSFASS